MVDPGSFACGSDRYILLGNIEIACEVKEMAKIAIHKKASLYETQDIIKQHLCEKYGTDWYEKSGYAVQHIIEDTYASAERGKEFRGMLWCH